MNFSTSYLNFKHYNFSKILEQEKVTDIFIVIHEKEDTTIYREFIQKIFTAVQKDFSTEITLIKLETNKTISLASLSCFKFIKTIFSFGVSPADLGFGFTDEQGSIIRLGNQDFVFSIALSELINNQKSKGILWNQLKVLFL